MLHAPPQPPPAPPHSPYWNELTTNQSVNHSASTHVAQTRPHRTVRWFAYGLLKQNLWNDEDVTECDAHNVVNEKSNSGLAKFCTLSWTQHPVIHIAKGVVFPEEDVIKTSKQKIISRNAQQRLIPCGWRTGAWGTKDYYDTANTSTTLQRQLGSCGVFPQRTAYNVWWYFRGIIDT